MHAFRNIFIHQFHFTVFLQQILYFFSVLCSPFQGFPSSTSLIPYTMMFFILSLLAFSSSSFSFSLLSIVSSTFLFTSSLLTMSAQLVLFCFASTISFIFLSWSSSTFLCPSLMLVISSFYFCMSSLSAFWSILSSNLVIFSSIFCCFA